MTRSTRTTIIAVTIATATVITGLSGFARTDGSSAKAAEPLPVLARTTTSPTNALDPAPVTEIAVESFTADEQLLVDFAYERFAQAGLELPAVTVEFPTDDSTCHGYGGVYVPTETTVRICRPSQTTMVHELAHAWVETTLTDIDRQAFLTLRGLDVWTGGDSWDQRGAEHAAEIITWAIMDRDISIRWVEANPDGSTTDTTRLFKIPDSGPDQLIAAYEQLAGDQPTDRLGDHAPGPDAATESISPEAR